MRPLLALLTIALLGLGASACGSAGNTAGSQSSTASNAASTSHRAATLTTTATGVTFDADDGPIRFYGHEASGAERQAISALVRRYYAAAARQDGSQACRVMHSLTAETVAEDYGQTPALRGKTCAVVMSKLFKQRHRELILDSVTLEAIAVRVEGGTALVLLRFAKASEPDHIKLRREGRTWRTWDLLAGHMP